MTNIRERRLWTAIGCLSALQALSLLLLFTGSQRPLVVVQHPEPALAGPRRALLEVGPRRRLPRGCRRRRRSPPCARPPARAWPQCMNICMALAGRLWVLGWVV